jgi:hypothetical protein
MLVFAAVKKRGSPSLPCYTDLWRTLTSENSADLDSHPVVSHEEWLAARRAGVEY